MLLCVQLLCATLLDGAMASAPLTKRPKFEMDNLETVVGFVHNVTELKTSWLKGTRYFNAILQLDREDFHEVAVFSPERRVHFVQAENSKQAVKLTNVSKRIGRGGEGYDVMCGRGTDVLVVEDVTFPRKDPPAKAPKTVAEIQQMGSKNPVTAFVGRAVFISSATESVPYYGNILETQTCYFEDQTGKIKVQLWDAHIGAIRLGKTYRLSNLSTRDFRGNVYITTTRGTQAEEVAALEGLSPIISRPAEELRVDALSGTVTRVEVKISRRCGHCKGWQQTFQSKCKNHRCERCNMLQRASMYEPTAAASFCVFAGAEERKLTVSNSVLKKYLESEHLMDLLQDAQNVEEHFLDSESYVFEMQDDAVVSMMKISKSESNSRDVQECTV